MTATQWGMIAVTVASHLVVPMGLIAWVGLGRPTSRARWVAMLVLAVATLALMHVAGAAWHWFGTVWRYLYWGALGVAVFGFLRHRWARLPWWPPGGAGAWVGLALVGGLASLSLTAVPAVVTARSFDGDAVPLRFPLRGGTFHVVHGGGHATVNVHHPSPAQRYALDVVAVNGLGVRAQGLWPRELGAYASFGVDVVAPCAGEVLAATDGLPDLRPPAMDPGQAAGNHVVLYCDGVTVILAHLARGSVRVAFGERVPVGALVGRVGNSGNTSEPHLHVHAVRGRVQDVEARLWTGSGVPLRFDGRFLIRNDRLTVESSRNASRSPQRAN